MVLAEGRADGGVVRELVNRVPFDFCSEVENEQLSTAGLPALPGEIAA